MKMKLKLKLFNIYGGDGFIRYEDKRVPKLSRKKVKSRKREDVGIAVEQATQEIDYVIQKTEIHTFKKEDDKYFLRLGGVHGKFWGLLKESGRFLKEVGDFDFKTFTFVNRLMKQIQISPIYCELKNISNIREDRLSQQLSGIGRAMIFPYFDVISECEVDIVLEFPEMVKVKVEKLLKQAQNMSAFNKRRGSFKIKKKGGK